MYPRTELAWIYLAPRRGLYWWQNEFPYSNHWLHTAAHSARSRSLRRSRIQLELWYDGCMGAQNQGSERQGRKIHWASNKASWWSPSWHSWGVSSYDDSIALLMMALHTNSSGAHWFPSWQSCCLSILSIWRYDCFYFHSSIYMFIVRGKKCPTDNLTTILNSFINGPFTHSDCLLIHITHYKSFQVASKRKCADVAFQNVLSQKW